MPPFYRYISIPLALALILVSSCTGQPALRRGESIPLASFSDPLNHIEVSIQLTRALDGHTLLTATFTPPSGYHLYSKDLPRNGVRGQGRPTLLELSSASRMQTLGALSESVSASIPGYVPDGAPVYPPGPVTLTLPVQLPDQAGWADDQISLTYMACTETICSAPTVGKQVKVRIPGAQLLTP